MDNPEEYGLQTQEELLSLEEARLARAVSGGRPASKPVQPKPQPVQQPKQQPTQPKQPATFHREEPVRHVQQPNPSTGIKILSIIGL